MTTTSVQSIKVTTEELKPIRDFVAEQTGIYFEEKKFYFLEKRVIKRIAESNCQSAKDYYRLLKLERKSEEFKNLINILTTNETYFYRNIPQLESFAEEALPLILEEKRKKGDFRLKIWSAASSSGEEAYTIAIMLREHVADFSKWRIEILASDIDDNILAKAKAGIYEKRAVKDVNPTLLRKYFDVVDGTKYSPKPEILKSVRFEKINLMDRMSMRRNTGQDFVFCRNVLIYFDDEARKQVVNSIYNSLNPGGFIFLGHSESVGKISAAFKLVKFKKSLSYRK
ncbi:MAG: chemotaxis protein methyltransferase CheR [bacterium]|jgi:chemotaxis protein methyltransferase CheR